jgi:hypothetical protein
LSKTFNTPITNISNKKGNKKMKTPPPELKLEMILNRSANNKYIFGTVVNIGLMFD